MIVTIAGRRYRVVESGIVVAYDKDGKPYRYVAGRVEPVEDEKK